MFKTLQLSDLLRYAFSGSIFLAAFVGSKNGISTLIGRLPTLPETTGFIAVAIIAGSLCYSIHRLVYRLIIIRIMVRRSEHKDPLDDFPPEEKFFEKEFKRDYARWVRRSNFPAFQENLQMWAAHVHFLYCSAWAGAAGAVAGRIVQTNGKGFCTFFSESFARATFYWTLAISVGFFFTAHYQDRILTLYDRRLATKKWLDRLKQDVKKSALNPVSQSKSQSED